MSSAANTSAFSRRGLIGVVALLSVSLLSMLIWSIFGKEIRSTDSAEANSFSRSALGHHAFVSLLRRLKIDTLVSRNRSGGKAGARATLVIAEPRVGTGERQRLLDELVESADHILVVLPKWEGVEDPKHPGWLRSVEPVSKYEIEEVLDALGIDAEVQRPHDVVANRGTAPRWRSTTIQTTPQLFRPQVLTSREIEPIIQCDSGTLVGWADSSVGQILVLSDPDLLANHGLARPGNASVMMSILDLVRPSDASPVVIDETLHGFGREPSIYRALFDFPLLLATLHVLAAVAILLWAGMARFGPPSPVAAVQAAGKTTLIENTAALLASVGHSGHTLARYLAHASEEARSKLHAPASLNAKEAEDWLDRIAVARGIEPTLCDLRQRVDALAARNGRGRGRRALVTARHIHRWKEEMIRGRSRNS
jgi:hypothetical protein